VYATTSSWGSAASSIYPPVGDGFVATLARPGGNITGLSAAVGEMTAKRLEFLKAIARAVSHVSYLANPQITRRVVMESEAAGRTLGLRVSTMFVRNSSEVARAFSTMHRAGGDGLIVDLTLRDHWKQIVDLSLKNRLPTAAGPREFVEAGRLVAYARTILISSAARPRTSTASLEVPSRVICRWSSPRDSSWSSI
jgi:putative ABC transport system substrate-binding protein